MESSVALQMDPGSSVSAHGTEGEIPSTTVESSLTADGRTAIRHIRKRDAQGRTLDTFFVDTSSDESTGPKFLTLAEEKAEFFKNLFSRRQLIKGKKKKKRKYTFFGTEGSQKVVKRRQRFSVPKYRRKHRMKDRGIEFPFTPVKHLPYRLYFTYEQLVLGGFLNHIKNLKYERSLKESLKDMEMEEDLENDDFQLRQYSYMDDDGPISPISEPGENLAEDKAEDIKVVETSSFIVDAQVPTKKEWQIITKKKKKDKPHTEM